MAHVFGVSNTSPDSVMARLEKASLINSASDVGILSGTTRLAIEKPKFQVILCLTFTDFMRNRHAFNSRHYNDVSVFVFASPIRLNELNVVALDYAPDRTTSCAFTLSDNIDIALLRRTLKKPGFEIARTDGQYLENMMRSVTVGSVLSTLMGHIYTMGNADQQFQTKMACCKWIAVKPTASLKALVKKLSSLECPPTATKIKKLCEILSSPETAAMRAMFKEILERKEAGKSCVLKQLCKAHGVQEFEVNYINAVLSDNAVGGRS